MLWFGRFIDASMLRPECTLGRETPVWGRLGHETALSGRLKDHAGAVAIADLENVVLWASLSRGHQWPTTVSCGHLSQMDTPL